MRVTIRLFAGLRERAGTERVLVEELPSPLNVGELKKHLGERYPDWGSLESVRGVLNETYVSDETPIEPDQELSLLPPVSGGAASEDELLEQGVFEIRQEALDAQAAWERVAHRSCGAICVFTGTTREQNRDQEVVRLDYEAFSSMAEKEMERIFEDCGERFGPASRPEEEPGEESGEASSGNAGKELLLRMLVQHRSGSVGVGEPSVIVAVASPHRDAAFQACRFLIDELKAKVPLWKKEIYSGGHHWIGERS